MLTESGQKILLEVLATGGLGGGMSGGATSGSGSVLEEDAYELEDGSSWDARFPLLKAEKTKVEVKPRKFSEFSGSAFGPGEGRAEGPEASFYYVGDGGESGVSKSNGEGYRLGEDNEEKFIDNSGGEGEACNLNAGKIISNNCGGYGVRKLPLRLDDEVNFDGGENLEKMVSYVSKDEATGIEDMGRNRTILFEEELFGVFKGREFGAYEMGLDEKGRIDLTVNELGELITFLGKGKEILQEEWNKGEIIEGGKMRLIEGKTRTLGNMIKAYLSRHKGSARSFTVGEKDLEMLEVGMNFLSGKEGQVGFSCESGSPRNEVGMGKYFQECQDNQSKLNNKKVEVLRVLKTVLAQDDGKVLVPKKGGGEGWEEYQQAFVKKGLGEGTTGWLGLWNTATGVRYKPIEGIMTTVLAETCTGDGLRVGMLESAVDREKRIKSEVCQEIVKPGFGDDVSNKRVCYFKFKDGPQNYLRRGNFFNGMLKIPVGYRNADGYGAKCSVHGI